MQKLVAEHLWSDSQSRLIRPYALSNGMVNHFADVPAAGGKRHMIHASHLLSKGADVKIINCLPQLSLRGQTGFLSVLSSFLHASSNLKCSPTFGNHAMAAGLMICASVSRASEIMRGTRQVFLSAFSPMRADTRNWCPRPELNRDGRFRKPLLYPFEVQGQISSRA